jgi:predicted ribosome quality control (RQC) complex YloA/Tae2 family protein
MACESPRARYVTLGAPVWEHLESKGWSTLTREQQWLLFYDELKELDSGKYFIHHGPTPLFSLHKQGAAQSLGGDVLTALTVFYRTAVTQRALESMRKTALTSIDRRLKTMRASLDEVEKRKKELGSVDTDARWADLIMAHLHAIPKGAQSVSLPDFDGASTVEIPLVKSLDPQRNAERYYRKSKNRKLERGRVEELILSKTQGLIRLAEQRDRVLKAQSAGELSAETDPGTGRKKAEGKPLPYMELDFKGYKILIGRNAASNDTLTTKVAAPNDEWLHARDCPGSHVVVRAVKGKVTPREVMARAAELAGWHSKRRHETLCPVIVTKRKYVRKRKGSAPGEVVVEREKVIFVTPRG